MNEGPMKLIISEIILFYSKVRDFFERLTDKVFFKGRYDTQQLFYILGRIMSTNIELDILTNKLLETIISQMRITRGVFILFGDEPKIYDIISNGFENEIDLSYDDLAPFSTEAELIIFDEIEENLLKQLMRKYGFSILRRMIVEERIVGYLALGEKSSGDIYSQQDVKVLEIIGSEIAIAIQNAKSFDKIKKFNVTLIQEITKATVDLKQANLKLKQLDKLKDDFVSVASHELRTPMTAIRSYVWMALHKSDIHLSQKLERYLYRTLVSTERLINLVNDMLNVSRIESGKIEIKPQAFDIVSLVNEVMEEVRAKADEKNLKLIVLEHKLPQMFADPDKVHQVLLNLIGNSLKFSYPGGIITADFLINGGMIEVSIKDQGSGIPKEDQVKLFHKFSRLDNSYTSMSISSGSGTGLGLYISRSLIDLMKGTIGVKSEGEDKGCIFTFSLPVATKEILANQDKLKTTPVDDSKPLEPVAI